MPNTVDEYVAENTQRIRDVDSRFVQVDSNRARDLSFGSNFFEVSVDVELYKRSTGDQIVFGHPSASKGFGRGTFGDDKGAWSLLTDAEASAEFTKLGRKACVEALNGKTGAVTSGGIGSGTSPASTEDTALGSKLADVPAFNTRSANVVRSNALYAATSVVGEPGEIGIFDEDDRLLARVTVDSSSFTVGPTDEVRGVVILTFEGDGNGASVVTSEGENALADSIASPKAAVGPKEFAFGDGSSDFSKSSTSLTSEQFRKAAGRNTGRDRVTAYTRVLASDMDSISVDLSEVGLFDNAGRMLWATTFRAIQSDSPGFDTETTIVVS